MGPLDEGMQRLIDEAARDAACDGDHCPCACHYSTDVDRYLIDDTCEADVTTKSGIAYPLLSMRTTRRLWHRRDAERLSCTRLEDLAQLGERAVAGESHAEGFFATSEASMHNLCRAVTHPVDVDPGSVAVSAKVCGFFANDEPIEHEYICLRSPDGRHTHVILAKDWTTTPTAAAMLRARPCEETWFSFSAEHPESWASDQTKPSYLFFLGYLRLRISMAGLPTFKSLLGMQTLHPRRAETLARIHAHLVAGQRQASHETLCKRLEAYDKAISSNASEANLCAIESTLRALWMHEHYFSGVVDASMLEGIHRNVQMANRALVQQAKGVAASFLRSCILQVALQHVARGGYRADSRS